MFNLIAQIAISAVIAIAGAIGVYNYAPMSLFEISNNSIPTFGSAITTINGGDTISSSRAVINDNFTSLNNGKVEVSTTTLPFITTLVNLASVGTITSGTWNASTLTVSYGGTGSTTLSSNQVLLGNGTGNVKTVNGYGTTGQFLTSNGSASAPTWTTAAIDQAGNYTWTGTNSFSATTTMATTTVTRLGVSTSTPSIANGLSVGGSAYITGGLGVGMATTSNGNLRVTNYLQVDGTASTTDFNVSGTCVGCVKYYSYSTSTSFVIGAVYNEVVNVGFRPRVITGTATLDGQNNGIVDCSFTADISNQSFIGDVGGAGAVLGEGGYICRSDQATDDMTVSFTNFTTTGFTVFWDRSGGGFDTGTRITATVIGN